jgi:hypothetical protein
MSLAMLQTYLQVAAPYTALAALVLALAATGYAAVLRLRFKRLAMGRTGSIEETISILSRDTKDLQVFRMEIEKYLKFAESRIRGGVSGIGIVRFNPFSGDGSGGNQSFAVALLDELGRGVVLSSLYARDRVGIYAKPIEAWASSYELTAEEKDAVAKAREQIVERKKQ